MASRLRPPSEAAKLLARLGIKQPAAGDESEGSNKAGAMIYFERDSVQVGKDYAELVRQCAERFNRRPDGMLIVSGHATGADEPEHEVKLSLRRTRAVAKMLESLGVPSHQIVCVSRGANEPLVDPSDSARRWINRRVEIREGDLVPRPPAWAQQRRKKAKGGKAAAATKPATPKAAAGAAPPKAASGVAPAKKAPVSKPVAKAPAEKSGTAGAATAKAPATRSAGAKAAPPKAAGAKAVAAKTATPAAKSARAKAPAAKSPARPATPKKPATKAAAAGKAAAKRPAKKSPATAAAKKATTAKAPARKAPAKKSAR